MIKRSTWIVLAILVLVVAAYFLLKSHPLKTGQPTPTATGTAYLVTPANGTLESLRIYNKKGKNFQMQRDLSHTWVITAPTSGEADQGLAGAAETQVGALSIITMFATPPDPSATGLNVPADTIELGFVSGASHKIEVGNLTPTSSGYYVRYDGGKIYVIAQSGINSLLNLLTAPPFPATATPAATNAPSTITPEVATPTP